MEPASEALVNTIEGHGVDLSWMGENELDGLCFDIIETVRAEQSKGTVGHPTVQA